jgi:P-type E1-E2 ATPase
MVTGDNARVAENVGRRLGLDEVIAECMPDTKFKRVREEKKTGASVAMVGDGVNDAPGLAAADVGIAMAAVGSDTAVEAGDVSLMKNNIRGVLGAFRSSKAVRRTISQNIFFAMAVNLLAVGFASVGHVSLLLGALLHQASALAVILNSMTLFVRDPMK